MQALHSLRAAPYPLDMTSERRHDSVSLAVETRTYWACFIMDCMVNSGTYTPPMLPMSEMEKMRIARPLSAVEFAFGPDAPPQAVGGHHSLAGQSTGMLDVTQSFEILVGGFDIWAQVMTFIFNDGRRAPGMCAPQNCPWVPGSPWSQSRSQLEAWRADQHRKLHYPSNSVAVHMTLGFGETFVYLNLLYYVRYVVLSNNGRWHRNVFRTYTTAAPSCFIVNTSPSCRHRSQSRVVPWTSPCWKRPPRKAGGTRAHDFCLAQQSTLPPCCTRRLSVACIS